jgi:ABC-2 type transport system permease protein
MRNFWIVLKYTFLENARKKMFKISTIILIALTILIFNIPNIEKVFSNNSEEEDNEIKQIVVYDEQNKYDEYLNNYTIPNTNYLFIKSNNNIDKLKQQVKDEEINAVIYIKEKDNDLTFDYIVKKQNKSPSIDIINSIIKNTNNNILLDKYNVDQDTLTKINTPITYELIETDNENTNVSLYVFAIMSSLFLYLAIYFYGYSVSMSISNEKTSRVIETLITSTKPSTIVLGKTIAMGLLGLSQLLLLIITAILSYKIFIPGKFIVFGETINFSTMTLPMLLLLVLYFILGYFLYAMLNAVTGSTVTKAEDINAASMPISFISLFSFYLGYFSLIYPNSPTSIFASIFPFSSAFTMPARMILGEVPLVQVIPSLLLLIVTIVFLAFLSVRLYSVAILHYGERLTIKDLFKISKNN